MAIVSFSELSDYISKQRKNKVYNELIVSFKDTKALSESAMNDLIKFKKMIPVMQFKDFEHLRDELVESEEMRSLFKIRRTKNEKERFLIEKEKTVQELILMYWKNEMYKNSILELYGVPKDKQNIFRRYVFYACENNEPLPPFKDIDFQLLENYKPSKEVIRHILNLSLKKEEPFKEDKKEVKTEDKKEVKTQKEQLTETKVNSNTEEAVQTEEVKQLTFF